MNLSEIEADLIRTIEQCRGLGIPADRLDEVRDLTEHDEPGVALENLCSNVSDFDVIVPAEIYDTLVRLGSHMRIDAKLLDVPTGEQILWRHHHEVTGIDLWTLLDEIARRMILR